MNWSELTNGPHTVQARADGVPFATVTVTVTNLGTSFLRGASATTTATIGGQQVTLQWQESSQNFVITSATSTGGGGGTADLQDLLGQWVFVSTILSTFYDHYLLERIETVSGKQVIAGTDLDDAGPIVAARVPDLISDPFPYDFALLDPNVIFCDLFVFNKTGPNTVTGADVLFKTDATGKCTTPSTGRLNPMTGTRTGAALTEESALVPASDQELRRTEDASAAAMQTRGLAERGPFDSSQGVSLDAIQQIVRRLQE